MRKLAKNRKGTAEVIGAIMLIMILVFFFTNVYLWHDVATKDANQLYLKQINSTFKIQQTGNNMLVVTANGGSDISLSRLWIVQDWTGGVHLYADLGNVNVPAGENYTITFTGSSSSSSEQVAANQQTGGVVVDYEPASGQSITCSVINTLGVIESTTFTQTS